MFGHRSPGFPRIPIVRTRELKLREGLNYLHSGLTQPTEEDFRVAAQLRAMHRIRKRQDAQQRKALANPENPPPPPPEGLKRGPKPDPFRELCNKGRHTQLTKREDAAFEALRKKLAPHATPSTFLRWLICRELETHRRKDCPTTPFSVDLNDLDQRQKVVVGAARSAAPRRL